MKIKSIKKEFMSVVECSNFLCFYKYSVAGFIKSKKGSSMQVVWGLVKIESCPLMTFTQNKNKDKKRSVKIIINLVLLSIIISIIQIF